MTVKSCPFCGECVMIVKRDDAWFFECRGTPRHRVQMEGMDYVILTADVMKTALAEWDRRVSE